MIAQFPADCQMLCTEESFEGCAPWLYQMSDSKNGPKDNANATNNHVCDSQEGIFATDNTLGGEND